MSMINWFDSIAKNVQNIINHFDIAVYPILVGVCLCLAASLLGVILILKRYSMIGDGLSHVSFGSIAICLSSGIAAQTSVFIAIGIAILFSFLLLNLGKSTKMKGDSLIAIMSSSALAIGYAVNYATGSNVDIESYLFGSIDFATKENFYLILPVAIIVVVVFFIFYNRIFSVTFDDSFASATGIKVTMYQIAFSILSAIVIVLGMYIMGSLLISAIVIFPALISMRVFKKFKKVMISSAIISVTSFLLAKILLGNLPTGSSVVIINLVIFAVFIVIGKILKAARTR